jgi:hypothetical protein
LAPGTGVPLPPGFSATRYDIAIHGCCAECANEVKNE